MKPIRVVLADDNAMLREGIRAILRDDPEIEIVGEAGDGWEAVAAVERLDPDVVVMDIGMPEMNGIEATRAISARQPSCRVLILSIHDDPEYLRPVLEAGAAGYVLKRAAVHDLAAAIRAVYHRQTVLDPSLARTALAREPGDAPATEPEGSAASAGPRPAGARGEPEPLSDREREVLVAIAQGLTNQEIADRLTISVKTVQAHRANIMQKLGLHDAVDLTKYALRRGLIQLEDG